MRQSLTRQGASDAEWPKVALALHTGLRRGERFGLHWEQIDFANRLITIPRSKSGELRRVPMNDVVLGLLRKMPSRLQSDWVFPSETEKTAIDAQNYFNRVFIPAVNKAKVDAFRWHDLRHTFAGRLVMRAVDLRTVQELMGHKTIQMTLRYAHLSPGHQLEAVQRVALNPGKPTGSATGTKDDSVQQAVAEGAEVIDLPVKKHGGAWTRTTDLGIMRPSL